MRLIERVKQHWKIFLSVCALVATSLASGYSQVTVFADPETSYVAEGEVFHVTVIANDEGDTLTVNGLEIDIAFDTSVFEVLSITDLIGWPPPLLKNETGNGTGIIEFAAIDLAGLTGRPQNLPVLDLEIRAKRDTSCVEFDFLETTQLIALNTTGNLIEEATSFYVSVGQVIDTTICSNESVLIGGDEFTEPGTYEVVIPIGPDCDSFVIVNLAVLDAGMGTQQYDGCSGDGYSVMVNGMTYDESNPTGTEVIAGGSFNGCDSIVEIDLIFKPAPSTIVDSIVCLGDSAIVGGTIFKTDGQHIAVLTAANGCDSTITLNLTVKECEKIFVDPSAPGQQSGATWTDAVHSIGEATELACFLGVDSVFVIDGTYRPAGGTRDASFVLKETLKLYGGFTGTESSLPERPNGAKSNLTGDIGVENMSGDNVYHVVRVEGTCTDCEINGFSIQDGNANGAVAMDQHGAGILCRGKVLLNGIMIMSNRAVQVQDGAVIHANGLTSHVIMRNVLISGNALAPDQKPVVNAGSSEMTIQELVRIEP